MSIGPIGITASPVVPRPRTSFKALLAGNKDTLAPAKAALHAQASVQPTPSGLAARVQWAQAQMDLVLRQAQAGRSFSPAELLCLQVRISEAAQVIDFTGKAVDKALGAVKQVLQTQV